MKNTFLTLFLCVMFQTGIAQNYVPPLKNNTVLHYICKLHGQTRTLTLKAKITTDKLILDLDTRGVKSSIVTTAEGLKSGNELSFNQGEYAPVLNLKPTETFFMISQSAYQDLVTNKQFIYNNTTYILDENAATNTVDLEGKVLDTLHVVAQIDETEMWIVKNSTYPLICKIIKNPLGINFTLVKITDELK